MQAHRMGDVSELLAGDFTELFAAGGKLFIDLDDFFGHYLVGLLRTADEGEIRAGGDAFVAVGIKSHTKENGLGCLFALFWCVSHKRSLMCERRKFNPVDWRSETHFRFTI